MAASRPTEIKEDELSLKELPKLKQQLKGDMLLATRLDIYYKIYQIATKVAGSLSDTADIQSARKNSLTFIHDVLDLPDTATDEEIAKLMADRASKSQNNPEYLPGKKPQGVTGLPSPNQSISKSQYLIRSRSQKALAAKRKVTLPVNENSRIEDERAGTIMFDPVERDKYRIIIRGGKFYVRQQDPSTGYDIFVPFNTTDFTSKGKTGLAGFVMNIHGEISVFNHTATHDKKGGVYHSSMNKGDVVFVAGELEIADGKLTRITPFSGHYRPDKDNVYGMLNYLRDKKVEMSMDVELMDRVPALVSQTVISKTSKLANPNRFVYRATAYLKHFDTLREKARSRRASEQKQKAFEGPVTLIQTLLRSDIEAVLQSLRMVQAKKSGMIGNLRNKALLEELKNYITNLEQIKAKLDQVSIQAITSVPATSANYIPPYVVLENIFKDYDEFYKSISDKIFIIHDAVAVGSKGKPLLHRELPGITFDDIYTLAFGMTSIKTGIDNIKLAIEQLSKPKEPSSSLVPSSTPKANPISLEALDKLAKLEAEYTAKVTWSLFSMIECSKVIEDWNKCLNEIRGLLNIKQSSPLRGVSPSRKPSFSGSSIFNSNSSSSSATPSKTISSSSSSTSLMSAIPEDSRLSLSTDESKKSSDVIKKKPDEDVLPPTPGVTRRRTF